MGGSSKKQTVGHKYFMALHFAICYGPVDKIRRILVGDRVAASVDVATSSQISITEPKLFGGDKREGGIEGVAEVMMGETTQTLPTLVSGLLPSPSPSFRGILSVFYDGLIAANNPYVKPWAFLVERITAGWHGGVAWNAAAASIPIDASSSESFSESFASVGSYTVTMGNGALYTTGASVYGPTLIAAAQNTATPALIYKAIDVTFTPASLSFNFRFTASNPDDACTLIVRKGAGTLLSFNPRREASFDALRRPTLSVGGGAMFVGGAGLSVSTWYRFAIAWNEDTGVWSATITNLTTSVVDASTGGTSVLFLTGVDGIGFEIDLGNLTCPTEYAALSIGGLFAPKSMNGVHIIYQCLTDPQWGMGYPAGSIDSASFAAAAATLVAEGFGLCLLWNQQEELGAFIRTTLDHIGGILYDDPLTGKFAIKLLRGDYDVGMLEVFAESKIVSLDSFQRVGYGETINEITVVYRDVITNKDVPVTVHNLANIQAQGAVVSQTRQYPGIPSASLAARVAMRDLLASSTPLAKARMVVNRSAWSLAPGAVFKLSWPKLRISGVVFRVLAIDYGALQDGSITVDIAEDVFGLPSATYAAQEPSGWVAPETQPTVITVQDVVESPYRSIVSEIGPADLAYVDPDSAFFSALAAVPSSTALGFDVWSRVGAAPFEQQNAGQFVPTATTSAAIGMSATTIVLATQTDLDEVDIDSLAIIGTGRNAEWVKVKTINVGTLTITVARGVLDTTPKEHASGVRIFFDDARAAFDTTERATGETVDLKLATESTGGDLDYSLATTISATAQQRQFRPYPPGKVQIAGVDWPTLVTSPLTVTWAHRDRLQQTAYTVEQSEASIGPEAGTTYNAYAYDDVTGSLLEFLTGITGTSWSPALLGTFTLRVEIESQRDGAVSWQRQTRTFTYNTAGRITEDGEVDRVTENDELRSQE